jgi:hypothetical protein
MASLTWAHLITIVMLWSHIVSILSRAREDITLGLWLAKYSDSHQYGMDARPQRKYL